MVVAVVEGLFRASNHSTQAHNVRQVGPQRLGSLGSVGPTCRPPSLSRTVRLADDIHFLFRRAVEDPRNTWLSPSFNATALWQTQGNEVDGGQLFAGTENDLRSWFEELLAMNCRWLKVDVEERPVEVNA